MFRLQRYVVRETAGLYVLGVTAFCLLLSIDLLSVLARFLLEQDASPGEVGLLLLYKVPWFLHLTLPLALVFAVLLATGRMARDSELKAAYAAGISPYRMLVPLVGAGIVVSGATILNNGYLEPVAERAYQDMIESFVYVRPPNASESDVAYRVPGHGVYYAARVIAQPGAAGDAELQGVVILSDDGSVTSAPEGTWSSSRRAWELRRAERLDAAGRVASEGAVSLPFDVAADPRETLAQGEMLTLGEMADRIATLGEVGGDVRELRFQLHRRLADGSSAVVFALLAAALGLRLRGRAAGFGWTIVLLVAFWAMWFLGGTLFERGVLGAVAAAWLTPAAVAVPTMGYVALGVRP